MTIAPSQSRYLDRPAPSSLADVVDVILDKGLVIDAYVRVSLVGIELLTIDARIVIASVDTYLRFAEAAGRLNLTDTETSGIPELMDEMKSSGAKKKTSGAIEGAKEKVSDMFSGDDDDDDEQQQRRGKKQQGDDRKQQQGDSKSDRQRRSSGSQQNRSERAEQKA